MDAIITQIPFIVVLLVLVIKVVLSVKKGAVKELFSLVSTILASVAVLLIAFAIRKYFSQERIIFVITIILLFLLLIVYKILDLFFTTMKLISKLPVVSFVNKILAIPLAICEVIVMVWAVYCLVMVLDVGAFEKWIMECVRNNSIMRFLYQYNYMYSIIANFSSTLKGIDIWGKLGM